MHISVNGEGKDVDNPCTITHLIEQTPQNHAAYAVEVNQVLIPRREHDVHELNEDDQVEIVTLVGGG